MKYLFTLFIFVSFYSCLNNSPYPEFSRGKEGVYFNLHRLGESSQRAKYGDFITADIEYSTLADSVFFSGRRKLQLTKSDAKGSIEACFRMLAEGESASFIISANEFFSKTLASPIPGFLGPESMLKIKLDILEIQTSHEYEKEKLAFLNWINDFGEYERVLLHQFLQEEQLSVEPTESGIHHLKLHEGLGKAIEQGDTVTVNYEGRFLNGKFFDSTVRRKQPFQFVYGTEWQVVKGLEEAIGMMHEGEKSLFIIPSELAFGTQGSSTGIIPPFTSLIFEVEILKIN